MSAKKAIFFDIDDTLYDQLQPFQRAYEILFPQYPVEDLYRLFLVREHYSNEALLRVEAGEMKKQEMYIYRMYRAMHDMGFAITEKEALDFQMQYKECQKDIHLSETMKMLLSEFCEAAKRTGLIYGIISNGPSEHQWNKVRCLELETWFPKERIYISGDTGYMKPDRRAFDHVIDELRIKADDAVYIGDNLINDIAGASEAGWYTVWLNRRPTEKKPKKAGKIVHSEEELRDLLRNSDFE